jgi:hypothetical protein
MDIEGEARDRDALGGAYHQVFLKIRTDLCRVRRAKISFSHEDFRRVVRGVRGEAPIQQRPSPAETIMNLWFRLGRAVTRKRKIFPMSGNFAPSYHGGLHQR